MSFTVQQSYRASLLLGLEMGKLIVPLKQIGITPLDALMSECESADVPGLTADGISEKHTGGEDNLRGWEDMQGPFSPFSTGLNRSQVCLIVSMKRDQLQLFVLAGQDFMIVFAFYAVLRHFIQTSVPVDHSIDV